MHNLLSALLLLALSLTWAGFLYHRRARLAEIFRRWDTDMVEVGLIAVNYWQAWRFAVILGWLTAPLGEFALPFTSSGVNQAAAGLSHAIADYWLTLLGSYLPAACWVLMLIATANLLGLIERKTKTRLLSVIVAELWWIGAALAFTIHTPAHDGGGLYGIVGLGAAFATVQLWARKDAEKPLTVVSRLLDWQHQKQQQKKRTQETRVSA